MEVNHAEGEILGLISQHYRPVDYPCLHEQYLRFKKTRCLTGVKILSSTPIFKNFYAKILPLVVSGAEISLTSPTFIKSDPVVINQLKALGFKYYEKVPQNSAFDIVLDCGAEQSHINASVGAIELTQSGKNKYLKSSNRSIVVDDSEAKKIEDYYGTSDGFVRALAELGFSDLRGKRFLLLGYGKVGSGVASLVQKKGGIIWLIDPILNNEMIDGMHIVELSNIAQISQIRPDFIVTATGVKAVVEVNRMVELFKSLKANLINLGAEDEYGPKFSNDEILNSKMPLNFILEEPTKLKFLDPTFALQNECAPWMRSNVGPLSKERLSVPIEIDRKFCEIFNQFNL